MDLWHQGYLDLCDGSLALWLSTRPSTRVLRMLMPMLRLMLLMLLLILLLCRC